MTKLGSNHLIEVEFNACKLDFSHCAHKKKYIDKVKSMSFCFSFLKSYKIHMLLHQLIYLAV